MKIVDRYMVRGFLGPFLWCLVLFFVLAIIMDIFSFIDNIVKYKIPFMSIVAFYWYYCPTILLQVTPMALLLSSIYVLSNLNKNNEITALKSSGISLWRILQPLFIIAFIVSIIMFTVNDKIIPTSSKMATMIRKEELEKHKSREKTSHIVKNVAIYGSGNRIVFARTFNNDTKTLEDVIIHEHDATENLTSKTTAQSGIWEDGVWKLRKVIVYRIDNAGQFIGEPKFYEERAIALKERPIDFINNEWQSDFVSFKDLKRHIGNFRGTSSRLVRSLLVDLHYKVAFSFISFVIILIGVPFALITTRGGVMVGVGMSIGIGLLYYAFIAIALAFGKAGVLPPFLAAWAGNIVFTGIGIYLINKRT